MDILPKGKYFYSDDAHTYLIVVITKSYCNLKIYSLVIQLTTTWAHTCHFSFACYYLPNCIFGFWYFLFWYLWSNDLVNEKTYNQCHLTKMKMVTTKTALLIIFKWYIVYNKIVYQHWEKVSKKILFSNKKSIHYSTFHKKGKKVTKDYAH